MGIFSSGPSLAEIDRYIDRQFDKHLGSPEAVGHGAFAPNYEAMLLQMKQYADEHSLSLWKRTRLTGVVEAKLRHVLPASVIGELVRKANQVILGV